jgi:hypothetical protein
MKRYTLAVVSLVVGGTVFGQTLSDGIKKTDHERYEEAGKTFKALVNQQGVSLGDVYFFYGDNFYKADDLDSAKLMWAKGADLAPDNAFSIIGQGKSLWLSGDTTSANTHFQNALKLTKRKNAEVIRQIASVYTYSPVKSLRQAVNLLNESIKLEGKNQANYLILGDAQAELNPTNSTEAMKSYNKAADINNNARVFVRKAMIYQRAQNPKLADSLYMVAQTLEPNYAPAYRERAELNMRFNQSKQSIANWEKYLQLNDSEYARFRYAVSLFEGKQYEQAAQQAELLHSRGMNNMYTKRILGFSLYEVNAANQADSSAFAKGWSVMEDLFNTLPADKVSGVDYKYKAMYYDKMGNKEAYLQFMEKAADAEPLIANDVYSELIRTHMKDKNYTAAITIFNKKMAGDSTKLTLGEYYELGRAYFFGPQDFAQCDKVNAYILKLSPDYAMSYLWRGRANMKMDGDTKKYSAKPYYEKFLTLLTEDERTGNYKSMAIEAYKFLGDYYFSSSEKDMDKAAEVWGEVQKLAPDDTQAAAFFKTYKKK